MAPTSDGTSKVKRENKNGTYQHLHPCRGSQQDFAPLADTLRLANEPPSHIIQALFKLLVFFVCLFVCLLGLRMRLSGNPLKGEPQFPTAFWVPWMSALLVFLPPPHSSSSSSSSSSSNPIGFLSHRFWGLVSLVYSPGVAVPDVRYQPFTGPGEAPYLWDPTLLHVAILRVIFLARLCLCPSYLSWCGLFILCCAYLVFRSLSEGNNPYVAVDLVPPWEEVNSGSSYATILQKSSLQGT